MDAVIQAVIQAVISVGLEALLAKLDSPDLFKFAREMHVKAELENWKNELMEICEVVDDAEEKQMTKQSVKKWLSDLMDLAYDMEDVLDEFCYEALPRKLKDEADIGEEGNRSKVCGFIPTCTTSTFNTPFGCMHNVKMGRKISKITTRLQGIYDRKTGLGLEKVDAITRSTWIRPLVTSLAYEPCVYGREADKQRLIDMLLRGDEPSETQTEIPNFSVVSIVAMGGMGKTTLARLVYDDVETTTKHFDLKAWASVSDQFDAERITNKILNCVTSGSNDSLDFHQSQDKLRDELKGKRFLLVLDDVWTEKYQYWSCLRSPFFSVSPGSKIIVTTRNKKIAAVMMAGDKNLLELQGLSHKDCWSVFKKHAFRNANTEECSNLPSIGMEIAKNCGGLPLAAEALGALLHHEKREERWNVVLNSTKSWESSIDECGILPALRLSYYHLSSPLKRCFSYCAIFPKGYEFDKEELIRLWMAECCLIPQSECDDEVQMEDIGDDYFEALLSRSFFHPSCNNQSLFVMHDLMNDLAKFVSREICFSLESNPPQQSIFEKVRYSSFIRGKHDVFKKFKAFHKMKSLRTFIALPIDALWYDYYISSKVLEELVPKLRRLRVLLLSGYKISEIPDSFGHDLKHLRYLNLSATKIKWLPDSIGKLYHLQTLILSKCGSLMRLPSSIGKLNNLRYLDVTDTFLQEMPPQINKLKGLQVLSNLIVSQVNGSTLNVEELKNMPHLRRGLCISKLENVVHVQHAREASLKMKHRLEELRMEWSSSNRLDGSQINESNQLNVLESLQPHSNLRKLSICCYGGSKFPHWIRGTVSFSKMVAIDLVNCRNCTSLPCLGRLPMLQRLKIEGVDKITTIGAEFYGQVDKPYPSLKSLSFRNMSKWEEWEHPSSSSVSSSSSSSSSSSKPYPHLLHLRIENCPSLINTLPTYLPSLQHLSISDCSQLGVSLPRLPSLSRLEVQRCTGEVLRSEITLLPSLTDLMINRIVELTRLHEGLLSGLQRLQIYNCYELTCLWENGFGSEEEEKQENIPSKLECLKIVSCNNLEKLPNGLHMLECLTELSIHSCPKVETLSEFGFPPMLRRLVISDCDGLTSLPDMMMMMRNSNNSSSIESSSSGSSNDVLLESLEIDGCPSLI